MKSVVVIPARYASSRLPGKPLAADTGKPLIQHVYEQAARARSVDRVIVATDDERIADAVRGFGGQAMMTRADHPSGTDRVAEVAMALSRDDVADSDFIVNLQGDEPEIDPDHIDQLAALLAEQPDAAVATLACPFAVLEGADPRDPNAVKVVVDARSRAIYFSRSLVPYPRIHDTTGATHQPAPYLLHLGVYAYRRSFLSDLPNMAPTPLERTEQLEQLRWIEHGYAIAVGIVDHAAVGIDTPADYAAFVERYRSKGTPSAEGRVGSV